MVAERDSLDGLPSAQDKRAFAGDTCPPQQEEPTSATYGHGPQSQAAAEAGRLLGPQHEKSSPADDYDDEDDESRAQSVDRPEYGEQEAQGRMTHDPERQQKQKRTIPASLADQKRRKKFLKEIISQILPMIVLSLVGSTLAGEIVEKLKFWEVFHIVPELFILVPIMLNLKGNIEMNLAARFSTSANIGELDIRKTRQTLVFGNLALLQVQALFVSLLAGIIAFGLGMAFRAETQAAEGPERGGWFECVLVLISSMVAAGLSSAIVGSFMCALVILSRKYGIDPDNIATPLAACLGDLLSLAILGIFASLFLKVEGTLYTSLIFVLLLAFVGLNVWFVTRNAYVQELLWAGWGALIGAMLISSGTGLILERVVNSFKGYGLLGPVVTGVAGNVGAVLVSRISTSLHSSTFNTSPHKLTAVLLFILANPVLIAFLPFAEATNQVEPNVAFWIFYSVSCAVCIAMALGCAHVLSVFLWKTDYDPDIHALPIMTAAMDVVGQVLLALAFLFAGLRGVGFTAEEREALPSHNNGTSTALAESLISAASATLAAPASTDSFAPDLVARITERALAEGYS